MPIGERLWRAGTCDAREGDDVNQWSPFIGKPENVVAWAFCIMLVDVASKGIGQGHIYIYIYTSWLRAGKIPWRFWCLLQQCNASLTLSTQHESSREILCRRELNDLSCAR